MVVGFFWSLFEMKNNLQSWHLLWHEKSICWLRPRFVRANFRHYWTAQCQRALRSTWDLNCPLEVPISFTDNGGTTWLQTRVSAKCLKLARCSRVQCSPVPHQRSLLAPPVCPCPFLSPKVGGIPFFFFFLKVGRFPLKHRNLSICSRKVFWWTDCFVCTGSKEDVEWYWRSLVRWVVVLIPTYHDFQLSHLVGRRQVLQQLLCNVLNTLLHLQCSSTQNKSENIWHARKG